MVQRLVAAGLNPEQLAGMFLVPVDGLSGQKPDDEKPDDL
jgi:hypothetical protein